MTQVEFPSRAALRGTDPATIEERLAAAVGPENVSREDPILISYCRDQSWATTGMHFPDFVVRPATGEEVREIVLLANRYGVPIIPFAQGANIAGLCVPTTGGILLDLRRMNRILDINERAMTATIESGVTFIQLYRACEEYGLTPARIAGPSTASPLANYINPGIYDQCARYGISHIETIKVVLGSGEVLHTGSRALPGTGPHWRQGWGPDLTGLFEWAVGSFGVVTEATCRLYNHDELEMVLIRYPDMDSLVEPTRRIQRAEVGEQFWLLNRPAIATTFTRTEEASRILEELDLRHCIGVGLMGSEKKRSYQREIIEEIVDEHGGDIINVPDALQTAADQEFDMSRRSIRLYYRKRLPREEWPQGITGGNYAACVFYASLEKGPEYMSALEEIRRKYGIYPVQPYLATPAERRGMYYECEVNFDATDPDERAVVIAFFMEAYSKIYLDIGIWGGVRPAMPINLLVLPHLWETGYLPLLRKIKKILDPNNIMNPHTYFVWE